MRTSATMLLVTWLCACRGPGPAQTPTIEEGHSEVKDARQAQDVRINVDTTLNPNPDNNPYNPAPLNQPANPIVPPRDQGNIGGENVPPADKPEPGIKLEFTIVNMLDADDVLEDVPQEGLHCNNSLETGDDCDIQLPYGSAKEFRTPTVARASVGDGKIYNIHFSKWFCRMPGQLWQEVQTRTKGEHHHATVSVATFRECWVTYRVISFQ